MTTQTVRIRASSGYANSVAKAYSLVDGTLVGTSATLTAADVSGIDYLFAYTDLPAGEYKHVMESSTGDAVAYAFAVTTADTAVFESYPQMLADRPPDVAAFNARTLPSAEYATSEQLTNLESARLPRLS